MDPQHVRNLIDLVEAKGREDLKLERLPYSRSALTPVMSKNTLDYHYGELARGYVDRYNNREGDREFNEAGAFLHNVFFPQFRAVRNNNVPTGSVAALIEKKFGTFGDFKKEMREEALKIQGSGWIYLSTSGQIKTIKNHQKRTDIVLLLDFWEHAYVKDYGANKGKYFDNIWRIMNWDRVNQRLHTGR